MRACPQCGAAEIEFNERYRVHGKTIPAWFCESPRCGYVGFVRARDSRSGKPRRSSSDLHVKAAPALMKAHAKAERSRKLIDRAGRLSRRKRNG
jgi:hypothetical protein